MKEKIVIIGAGLGGLSAGALLAKAGYKVTVLEQHNKRAYRWSGSCSMIST